MITQQYEKIKKLFSESLFVFFEKLVPKNEKHLVAGIFQKISKNKDESLVKLKLYLVLKALIKRKRSRFGMLVVYNWKKEWFESFASFPDSNQNLFSEESFDFLNAPFDKALEIFSRMSDFDGAVILSNKGLIIASGVYLEKMEPKSVAAKVTEGKFSDLSEAYGFSKKVHTRHLSGIACSYKLDNTTVFAVSEEDGSLRAFEKGKIVFSTVKKEITAEL